MTRARVMFLAFLAMAVLMMIGPVGMASAAEEVGVIPSVKQGVAPLLTAIVVFTIVAFVLMTQVWPKVNKGLEERSAKIQQEIASAEAARKQAKAALDEYEANLAEARAESQKMLEETKAEQAKMSAELRAKADVELTALRDKARRDIEAAKRAAINEIYAEAVTLSTTMASKILQREVSAGDQERLLEESIAELKSATSN